MVKILVSVLFAMVCAVPVSAGTLDELDFMTGVWRDTSENGIAEEWWMPADGNTKVAAFRWVQDGEVLAIELVIIAEEADGTFLRFKHYDAAFVPWEKNEPNEYKLVDIKNQRAVFTRISDNDRVPDYLIYQATAKGLRFRGTQSPDLTARDGDLILDFKEAN